MLSLCAGIADTIIVHIVLSCAHPANELGRRGFVPLLKGGCQGTAGNAISGALAAEKYLFVRCCSQEGLSVPIGFDAAPTLSGLGVEEITEVELILKEPLNGAGRNTCGWTQNDVLGVLAAQIGEQLMKPLKLDIGSPTFKAQPITKC